ncbi:DeoR/GlpR family DNA-binding transcription regulator [Bryobacter aggregatus]|uniref:DeoR/GlpR family DNA-binding transcription regulator n=1 Tax=Bryobacter aggregatus TaxID=360054 RepID=UPI0004E0F67A|nr:DeoR/GlpR family DNA-binding transcription regulator [Bryobacter aggregatus]
MDSALTPNRQEDILQLLRQRTSASFEEIARHFGVSEMTVRRDLQKLMETGEVIRIPGGARTTRSVTFEKTFTERMQRMALAKEKIGRAAANLIQEHESIVLDSGTTTLYIARHLRTRSNIVVLTFSLAVIDELAGNDSVRVELTGGTYRRGSQDLIGHAVAESLSTVCADKVFFGAAALSLQRGAMVFDPDAQRSLLRAGIQRILVIDSSKIGTEALYNFTRTDNCDMIITDDGIHPEHLEQLTKQTRVLVAE